MRVTIHQPEHLSYLGFWEKIMDCDKLVLLDNVQFEKNYYQNRNKITTSSPTYADVYITVPVEKGTCLIKDKRISKEFAVKSKKILKQIAQTYSKCEFFCDVYPIIERHYNAGYEYLIDLNVGLLNDIVQYLGIKTEILTASSIGATGNGTDLIVDICNKVGATEYVSGQSGVDYLEFEKFSIPVEVQSFQHPTYRQIQRRDVGRFIPYLSIIDALFNVGPSILTIIEKAQWLRNK